MSKYIHVKNSINVQSRPIFTFLKKQITLKQFTRFVPNINPRYIIQREKDSGIRTILILRVERTQENKKRRGLNCSRCKSMGQSG